LREIRPVLFFLKRLSGSEMLTLLNPTIMMSWLGQHDSLAGLEGHRVELEYLRNDIERAVNFKTSAHRGPSWNLVLLDNGKVKQYRL
jgi:hypothetical protein